jgi:IS30 family transposase
MAFALTFLSDIVGAGVSLLDGLRVWQDRRMGLARPQRLTLATEVEVHFCDPRSRWQRGSNENTNRLLRQYLPRGTDLSLHINCY